MSGHSKWSQIKRQKGAADVKKGQTFTRLSRAITLSVMQGGGITQPESNFKLRLAVEKAREQNMPKENIQKAIKKGAGKLAESGLEEVIYEVVGIGGVMLLIQGTSDNKNRTTSELKNILEQYNLKLASPGSVLYAFKKEGLITIAKDSKSLEEVFQILDQTVAYDVSEGNGSFLVSAPSDSLENLRDFLVEKALVVLNCQILWQATNKIVIDKAYGENLAKVINRLEALDDIDAIYCNYDYIRD